MPRRLIREGYLTSERVDELRPTAEVLYVRLMLVADDFGLFDARPRYLRTKAYPGRVDSIREADISRQLAEVQQAGLIALYEVDGKPYGQILRFKQTLRTKQAKYPPPDPSPPGADVVPRSQWPRDDPRLDAHHMRRRCGADEAHVVSETETETETDTPLKPPRGRGGDPEEKAAGPEPPRRRSRRESKHEQRRRLIAEVLNE